jgi:cell division protein FtsL
MLTESIRDELVKVFTVPQAEVLAQCVVKAHDTLATRSDMHELRTALTDLATQQKLTSAEVRELAEQQKLTSAEVRELAEQQKLTSAEVRELAEQQKLTSAEVRDLAEQQKLTSAELQKLTLTVADLSSTVTDLSSTVTDLSSTVADLSSTVTDLSSTVTDLSSTVTDLSSTVADLSSTVTDLSSTVADLGSSVRTVNIRNNTTAGWALEWVVCNHLPAYVGRQIKRCRVIGVMDVVESLEKSPAVRGLTAEDLDQLSRADLIATGTIDGEALYLVGEVSFTADNDDVLRATRRAAVLTKAGERSQPFVACDAISPISAELARREGVWVIVKGRLVTPAA